MNDLHLKILELIKEIDTICRKYDITYYAAGGTTIGAVRHHGFIPWDDDIDIYMTREEFERFRQAFAKEQMPDRVLECLEDNPEYPGTIPRYINTATTDLCRFHCLNTCAGGILIDIFILDPIPSEKEKQDEYRALLSIYADYVMPYYAFSYRNDSKYLPLYLEYKELENEIGRENVIKSLEEKLFTYDETNCEYYMLRWATLPSIFKKEMFGQPEYIEFEDIKLPVPHQWYRYLKQLYGFDWMYVPQNVENQIQHVAVINTELSYKNYTKELDEFIDKTSAEKVYQKRKLDLVKRELLDRPFQEKFLKLKGEAISKALTNAVESCEYTLDELLSNKKYIDILEIADHYITSQLSTVYAGKMKHGNWHRYKNPLYIPVKDEILSAILYSLIACNEIKKAERLLEIRNNTKKESGSCISAISNLLSDIGDLYEMYYTQNYDQIEKKINKISVRDQSLLPVLQIKYLYLVQFNDTKRLKGEIEQEVINYPQSGEILKAYADCLFNMQEYALAKKEYAKVLSFHNGVLNLDIKKKIPDIEMKEINNISIKKYNIGEHYTESINKRQKMLLDEIHTICKTNNIKYSLVGDTALFVQYEHRLPHNRYVNTILMTPENALRFIDAVNNAHMEDRVLDYMKTNPMHIGDDIYYGDTSTTYVNINTLYNMKDLGLFIRIVIARPKKGVLSSSGLITSTLEAVRTVDGNMDRLYESKKRKLVKTGSNIAVRLIGKEKLNDILFQRIYTDKKSTGKPYYTVKRKRIRKRGLNTYTKNLLDNITECPMEDINLYVSKEIEEIGCTLEEDQEKILNDNNLVNGLWVFSSTDIGSDSIKQIIDVKSLIQTEDWLNHVKSKTFSQQVKTSNRKIKKYWQILLRADDRILLWKKYEAMKDTIIQCYKNKEFVKLEELFAELDETVKRYAEMGLGFYFVSDVFDIYYKWLEENGCKDLKKYKKLVPDYYMQPIRLF